MGIAGPQDLDARPAVRGGGDVDPAPRVLDIADDPHRQQRVSGLVVSVDSSVRADPARSVPSQGIWNRGTRCPENAELAIKGVLHPSRIFFWISTLSYIPPLY